MEARSNMASGTVNSYVDEEADSAFYCKVSNDSVENLKKRKRQSSHLWLCKLCLNNFASKFTVRRHLRNIHGHGVIDKSQLTRGLTLPQAQCDSSLVESSQEAIARLDVDSNSDEDNEVCSYDDVCCT